MSQATLSASTSLPHGTSVLWEVQALQLRGVLSDGGRDTCGPRGDHIQNIGTGLLHASNRNADRNAGHNAGRNAGHFGPPRSGGAFCVALGQ